MKFKEKVVFVTGGSRGIGREIVSMFAMEGATVLFTYNQSQAPAMQLETELRELGAKVKAFAMDVTDYTRTISIMEEAIEQYGDIHILVNNAGITNDGFLMFMDEAAWDDVLDTNLKGAFNCCKAAVPSMMSQRCGVIINIASTGGLVGTAGQTNYSASKAGLIGFTRSLSRELARKNIRVNAVAPGYIATDMVDKVPESIRDQFKKMIPCGRIGEAQEVAKVVMFLASDDASYIYGQTIVIDGGMV